LHNINNMFVSLLIIDCIINDLEMTKRCKDIEKDYVLCKKNSDTEVSQKIL